MENERITSAAAKSGEGRMEAGLRPQHLDDYIGQQGVKENLKIFIEAARLRGEPLDHVLFTVLRDLARPHWQASLPTKWAYRSVLPAARPLKSPATLPPC